MPANSHTVLWFYRKTCLAEFRLAVFSFFLIFISLFFLANNVHAEELIISAITLNQQPKGEFFVYLREDGDFLVRSADLEEMGLIQLDVQPVNKSGEDYYALSSITGLTYQFDENTLTIDLMAEPELLPTTRVDLASRRRQDVYYPNDNSFFFNYGLEYQAADSNLDFTSFSFSHEIGARFRDLLFLSDGQYRVTPDESKFIRLNTSITHDSRETDQRLVLGDFFTSSGALGSQVNMGGISFSKVYRIDPYFVRYPLFDFSGQASLPSEVEVYLDGVKLRTEEFAPGEFSLQNFEGAGGARTIEVVVRDALGREQRYLSPFYFTDQLLRKGLHEYSYNLGLLRRDFGVESNSYANLAFSAFHRYGLTDSLNLGARGEASGDLVNFGIESIFKLNDLGLFRLEGSTSRNASDDGFAGLVSYEYQAPRLSGQVSYQHFSHDYQRLNETYLDKTLTVKSNLRVGLGYTTPHWGSFSADYTRTQNYEEASHEITSLNWSKRLWKRSYFNTSLRQIKQDTTAQEAWVSLTLYFGDDYSATSLYRHEEEANILSQDLRKTTPTGEGVGWEVSASHAAAETDDETALNGFFQYNARRAILRGDYSENFGMDAKQKRLAFRLSGALLHIGDVTGFSRPVTDSFALVTVGDAEDVQVNVNGQEIGRTNPLGKVVIPALSSYYDNRISFEDKDLPIDYLMPQVRLEVSPPLRSGSCINFPLQRYQAFTGTLQTNESDGAIPLSDARIVLKGASGPVTFWTDRDGNFYFDNQLAGFEILKVQGCETVSNAVSNFMPAGTYPVTIWKEEESFQSTLTIPASDTTYTELGALLLSNLSGKSLADESETKAPEQDQLSTEIVPAAPPP